MKKKTAWFYFILMVACVALNVGIRLCGTESLLNYFSVLVSAFTCGLYVSEITNLYLEEDKDEKSEQN